jgi:uncharacterized protein YceH (UPF0502 family)
MTELTPEEQRVLGALLEKQYVTPDAYPMTMNGLLAASNQTSNRTPVVSYDESTIHRALDGLREQGLLRIVYSPSNRATKYRQVFEEERRLTRQEAAILCVLLLRGPQTVGELRGRTERLATFASLEEVEEVVGGLAARPDEGLVTRLERQPGQKDARWAHTLGEVRAAEAVDTPVGGRSPTPDRMAALEEGVASLRADLDELRQAFDALRAELM